MKLRVEPRRTLMLEPMLPLINVVFLLLVFFMVAGQLGKKPPVPLTTPETSRESPPMSDVPSLSLDDRGRVFLGENEIGVARLREEGARLLPGPEPRLHADAAVTTAQLRPVLKALRDAGFDSVKLVTRRAAS